MRVSSTGSSTGSIMAVADDPNREPLRGRVDDPNREPLLTDWIIVRNWEKFQHYRDRQPPWIKLYTSLLRDPRYLELSMGARGLLITIWMAFGCENGTIRVQDVSHFAHKRISKVQLISLNHAGFIRFSASKPLALKTEVETERDLTAPVDKSEQLRPVVRYGGNEPSLLVEAFELVNRWSGGPSEELDEMLDALERTRHRRLRASERARLWDFALKRLER